MCVFSQPHYLISGIPCVYFWPLTMPIYIPVRRVWCRFPSIPEIYHPASTPANCVHPTRQWANTHAHKQVMCETMHTATRRARALRLFRVRLCVDFIAILIGPQSARTILASVKWAKGTGVYDSDALFSANASEQGDSARPVHTRTLCRRQQIISQTNRCKVVACVGVYVCVFGTSALQTRQL